MNEGLKQFQNQQYLNIETFRKNGAGVKTPVWFAEEDEILFIWTSRESGKVMRIRRHDRVRIVPCDVGGKPLGQWIDAKAMADDSPDMIQRVEALFNKKYGFTFTAYKAIGVLRGGKRTIVILNLK